MWIRIDVITHNMESIFLPRSIASKLNSEITISFGQRTITAKVKHANDFKVDIENTPQNPLRIVISDKLQSKLLIPKPLIYQMKINNDIIEIGPVIGLLSSSGNSNNASIIKGYSDHFKIANQAGGLFYVFSPANVDWENSMVNGAYYNYINNVWEFGRFPLPTAIYVRSFSGDPNTIQKLLDVCKGKIFNSLRFTKYHLYQYVNEDEELAAHLPPTELSNDYAQIKTFIDNYGRVILKPINLSRGRGICIIQKENHGYTVSDYRGGIPSQTKISDDTGLEKFFIQNNTLFNGYLIQKLLPLARVDGSPFDIRVVMQKDETAVWRCTGVECRVAKPGFLLTNISRGGYALTIDKALQRAFPNFSNYRLLKQQLWELSHKLCAHLDKMGQHFAEFGLDIAIDKNKNMWIIEVNVLPSFNGFKDLDYRTYLSIRSMPILYAVSLAGF